MRNHLLPNIFLVAICGSATIANSAELPFRLVSTRSELASLSGSTVIATQLSDLDFRTAATVKVRKKSYGALANTQRTANAIAMVYREAIDAGPSPGAQAVPPAIAPEEFVDYEENLNSAQSWATMSEAGIPFVMIYADGQSEAQSAASWTTTYVVPGSGSRDVYAQIKIPAVRFGGRWEDAAPSLTRGRLRADFLVNGYPAWYTEAVRWNEQNAGNGDTVRVDTFGYSIGLEGNSVGSNTHILSTSARTVTLKLGTYPAGTALDLSMLFQAEGKGDSECKPSGGEMDCGNISMKFDWDPAAPEPKFFSKPAT